MVFFFHIVYNRTKGEKMEESEKQEVCFFTSSIL